MISTCEPQSPGLRCTKQGVVLHFRAGAGSRMLTLSLFIIGGCSGSGDQGRDDVANVAANHGLDRSEFVALKKAYKNPKDFNNALQKRDIEKLREQGIVEKTRTSGKTRKRP